MMSSDPTLSYRQASARGASPVGQVVSLYDTILRDLVRALAALQAADVETRIFETNHALLVIAHLQNVLDYDRGGEPAKTLARFYDVARGEIIQANIQATPKAFEDLVSMFGGIREAWYQAEQQSPAMPEQIRTSSTPNSAVPPRPQVESNTQDESDKPQLRWSA